MSLLKAEVIKSFKQKKGATFVTPFILKYVFTKHLNNQVFHQHLYL